MFLYEPEFQKHSKKNDIFKFNGLPEMHTHAHAHRCNYFGIILRRSSDRYEHYLNNDDCTAGECRNNKCQYVETTKSILVNAWKEIYFVAIHTHAVVHLLRLTLSIFGLDISHISFWFANVQTFVFNLNKKQNMCTAMHQVETLLTK